MVSSIAKIQEVPFDSFKPKLEIIEKKVKGVKFKQINSKSLRQEIRQTVQDYFRNLRLELIQYNFSLDALDSNMQELLKLTNGRSLKKIYTTKIKSSKKIMENLEIEREYNFSNPQNRTKSLPLDVELKIIQTLNNLIPAIGNSYKQIISDLNDDNRISFRGTTAELREVLREVLDNLAPDQEVKQQKDFKLEPNTHKPTMKQKVRFILKARGQNKTEMNTTENTTALVDGSQEMIATIARSTYEKGSVGTHTDKGSPKASCKQYKMYVDSVLCELLEIHNLPMK
ncbi:MAG: hypothetical protein WCV50_05660 [Patescibacteria group bacterium]|jgi:hypothetical protein